MKQILTGLFSALILAAPVAAQDINYEVFGGVIAPDSMFLGITDYDTNRGEFFGVSASKTGMLGPNVELGLELTKGEVEYTGLEPNHIGAVSAMITVEATTELSPGFELYGGGGVGAMRVEYFNAAPFTYHDTVVGASLVAGGRFELGQNMSIFVEARAMRNLQPAMVAPSMLSRESNFEPRAIVVGLRFSR
jgi:opacity protein-like surface antigen